MRSWNEECGLFGIWQDKEAAQITHLGLYAQQHRGQEACGIISLDIDQGNFYKEKSFGYVADVFKQETLDRLKGDAAIGHVRYSTSGKKTAVFSDIQPLFSHIYQGDFCFAHNGNILNADEIKQDLKEKGAIFQGSSDSEILSHLISHYPDKDILTCLKQSLKLLKGAYSFVALTKDKMIGIRDPLGMRPLVLGRRPLKDGKFSYVLSSETCAFDLVGADYVREIEPGEIFYVDSKGEHSEFFMQKEKKAQCIFEHVYFSRPDSITFGQSVYQVRKQMGIELAKESSVQADIVVPVPDSGMISALGFSEESGIPFEIGIIRNHYVGRTFIQPSPSVRSFGVKVKLNPQSHLLRGKKVIVIDDSLVRGTTSKKLVSLLRQFGAQEVHLRIASPPIIEPCYYGIDTPNKSELIASSLTIDKIKEYIGADSLSYLSLEGLKKSVEKKQDYCSACFTEHHPM